MYVSYFPWNMTKKEKELDTVEKLEKIMLKMAEELNLKETLENENLPLSDYENVEYWG